MSFVDLPIPVLLHSNVVASRCFDGINSSICEQFNSFLQKIKTSGKLMGKARFVLYLQFFIEEYFYLQFFIEEYQYLHLSGIPFNGQNITIRFLCDAPARQFLKSIKSHNGYNGRERCEVEGESIERRMIFHDLTAPLRTDAKFCGTNYPEHQMKESLLCHSGILCVRGYALDYMHLEGPSTGRLSTFQINLISSRLENYRNLIPSEFSRQP